MKALETYSTVNMIGPNILSKFIMEGDGYRNVGGRLRIEYMTQI